MADHPHREAAARIIDPSAWAFADEERKDFPADPHETIYGTPRVRESLQRAAAILSLPSDTPPEATLINAYADLAGRAIEASKVGNKERFDFLAIIIGGLKLEYPELERVFTDEQGRPHG